MITATPSLGFRILVVEDNVDLALGLGNNLEIEGYEVLTAHSGEAALEFKEDSFDLVILDLMLPGLSGIQTLRRWRGCGVTVPILVLTARGEESDKVEALRLGADDYLTKPFGLLELLARVEALLRRCSLNQETTQSTLRLRDLEVRSSERIALLGSVPLELTPKEFDLLFALLSARGAAVSRGDLLRRIWGYRDGTQTRTVDTHIAELRRKIEVDPGRPKYIRTVRKMGYRMEAAE